MISILNEEEKYNLIIKFLVVIALICSLVYCSIFFLPKVSVTFDVVFDALMCLGRTSLFLIFVCKFRKKNKSVLLFPIILCLITLEDLFSFFMSYYYYTIVYVVLAGIVCISVGATIALLKGKYSVPLLMAVGLLSLALQWGIMSHYIEYIRYFKLRYNDITAGMYINLIGYIGEVIFYIGFILFIIKNKVPGYLFISNNLFNKEETDEQRLSILKDKLEFGVISEEEYNKQRTEIIKNL